MSPPDISRFSARLILALLFFTAVAAAAAQEAPPSFLVERVMFVGVKGVDAKELAKSLAIQARPFWKPWEPRPVALLRDLEEDKLRIGQFYQDQGYYQAKVDAVLKKAGEVIPVLPSLVDDMAALPQRVLKGKQAEKDLPLLDVEFTIAEGPAVMISNIRVTGLPDDFAETLAAGLPLRTGGRFVTPDYEKAKAFLRQELGNRGYPFAKVSGRALVDVEGGKADIRLSVEAGKHYNFGEIRISGHEGFVKETVIRRAVAIKRGEPYSAEAMDKSRASLFDLTIFKTAAVKAGEPDPEHQTLPIDIVVKPRKKQSVKLGVGYGTDDGLRLQGAWSYRNLTGHADRITLRARRSDIMENLFGEYLFPYFLSSRNDLTATAGYEEEQQDYYTLDKTVSEIILNHRFRPGWRLSVGYKLEANRPRDISAVESGAVIDPRDTENFLVSSSTIMVERSTVDDVLTSKQGTVFRLFNENAAGYLGSEVIYFRPGAEARWFVPLPWKEVVAAFRAEFQTIQKAEDTDYIPISKQYFMGGSKTVRGYGYEKMGVVNHQDVITDISGLSSFLANVEFRFPLYKELGGVVFLDSGALSRNAFEAAIGNLRYAAGAGLRYYTIIGPVQLDFGYKLNPAKQAASDDPLLTSLAKKDRWYLHFNIGQTF